MRKIQNIFCLIREMIFINSIAVKKINKGSVMSLLFIVALVLVFFLAFLLFTGSLTKIITEVTKGFSDILGGGK